MFPGDLVIVIAGTDGIELALYFLKYKPRRRTNVPRANSSTRRPVKSIDSDASFEQRFASSLNVGLTVSGTALVSSKFKDIPSSAMIVLILKGSR
jgi:hypothetical protein